MILLFRKSRSVRRVAPFSLAVKCECVLIYIYLQYYNRPAYDAVHWSIQLFPHVLCL